MKFKLIASAQDKMTFGAVKSYRMQSQTETAGTSKNFEVAGRSALIRMLDRTKIELIDSATFQVTWQAEPDTRMACAVVHEEYRSNRDGDDWGASAHDNVALDSQSTGVVERLQLPLAARRAVRRRSKTPPLSSSI